jgi:class 3 adenylate cyclase
MKPGDITGLHCREAPVMSEQNGRATVATAVGAVLFADLTGFRTLTQTRGDEGAAEAATRFVAAVRRSLAPGALLVKTLGDGVLVVAPSVAAARMTAERIRREVLGDHTLPPVHAGICAGSVVWRDGDVFGAAVNDASRLADAAGPSEIVEGPTHAEPKEADVIRVCSVAGVLPHRVTTEVADDAR